MTIAASLVKELRDATGAGMMDCKRALEETGGDVDQAQRLLREKGIAAAGKRAGRETTEGKVLARVDAGIGAIVAVGCETEPVSKNEEFVRYARGALAAVFANGPQATEALETERVELVARIGENIEVRGAERYTGADDEVVAAYVHPPADRIGVLVRMHGTPELARLLAMHISFANPRFLTREEVPESELEGERAILEKLPEVGAKPEHIRPQILEGMLQKRFFADAVLADQAWIHDDAKTVGRVLSEHGAEVRAFVRMALSR